MATPRPPRLAEWIVRFVAGPAERDHVAGDLLEEFTARVHSSGRQAARAWYHRQTAASLLPLIVARWHARHEQAAGHPERNMDSVKSDLSYALRALARRPAFAIVATLTLALGIGAATAIFTVVDGVLLRPLPFERGEQLVTIWQTDTLWRHQATLRDRWDRLWFTYPDFQRWSGEQRSLSGVALFGDQEMALTGAGDPLQVSVATATPSLLSVLETGVALGRWFAPNEVGPGAERLAVLSHELWQSRFGADRLVLGRAVVLDDKSYRVVGVLPENFALRSLTSGRRTSASIWIPLGSDGGGQNFDSSYEAIGRLRLGVPLAAAALEIDGLQRVASGKAERGARVLPRLEAETGAARSPLVLIAAGVGLLLLMACGNVAMLLLGEAPARALEIATRRAIGASTQRIVRQLLTESVVLASIGGVLGVAVAFAGVRLLIVAAPAGLPRVDGVGVNANALLFCLVAIFTTALAFGLAPALLATRGEASEALRARAGQLGKRQKRLQGAAIAMQVAMALVLVLGATVLTRSLRNLNSVNLGIRRDDVLTVGITAPEARYATPAAVTQYYDAVEARLAAIPGVRAVGATSNLPFAGRNQTMSVEIEGAAQPGDAKPNVQRRVVRSGVFAALGISLRDGRLFAPSEPATSDAVIVDETMANRLWPGERALGKRVKAFGAWLTVVGVVAPVYHTRLDEPPRPTFYLPHARLAARQMTFVLRVDGDPLSFAPEARRALWSVDGSVPIASMETMSSRVAQSLSMETYRTVLLDLFGAAAALLTGVGVFGVTVRAVGQRRRELGIRIALGAESVSVAREVARGQVWPVVVGLVGGLAVVVVIAPLLGRFAFAASATDATTIGVATAVLVATIALAAVPAVRAAMRIDPGVIVRDG